jgi:DNA-binding transcriptional LysR family regulator
MLSLAQVSAFVAVIDAGTFQGAAARLGLSQATVSQHVRSLEDSLGVPLIARSRVGCTPTAHGQMFLRHARALLRTADHAERSVRDRPTLIGASGNIGTYLLQPYLRRFLDLTREQAAVNLTIAPNPEIAERLQEGSLDVGVMEWWDDRPGFVAYPWRRENMVVIVAPDHPWTRKGAVSKDELLATPLIGGEPGTGTATLMRKVFGSLAEHLRTSLTLGSTEAVKAAVKAKLGVSLVLAAAVRDELAAGTLHALAISGVTLEKEMMIVLPSDTPPMASSARLADLLRAEV